jgi:hypothetical protein
VRNLTLLLCLAASSICGQSGDAPTSPANPLYLYAHFRDTDDIHLRLSYSHDQTKTWTDLNPQGSFTAPLVRDPSITYIPETSTFAFVMTPAVGTQVQFFTSQDLVNFSAISTIDISAFVHGATVAWAPEWWRDPQDGKYYFFIAVSTDPDGATSTTAPMTPWLVPFDPIAGAITSPPAPLTLWGTTQSRTFDFFPWYDGTQYCLLYVDQQPGGSGADVVQPIALATSPTLAGPYTQQTLTGSDAFGLGSFHTEAPTLIRIADANCVRMIFDSWTVQPDGSRLYAPIYRDSCTGDGAPLFSPASLRDGPSPLHIVSEHGTIVRITDPAVAALVWLY